jgi:hypothetical protein
MANTRVALYPRRAADLGAAGEQEDIQCAHTFSVLIQDSSLVRSSFALQELQIRLPRAGSLLYHKY